MDVALYIIVLLLNAHLGALLYAQGFSREIMSLNESVILSNM